MVAAAVRPNNSVGERAPTAQNPLVAGVPELSVTAVPRTPSRPVPLISRRISAAARSTAPWATIAIVEASADCTISVMASATRRPDLRDSPPGGAISAPEAHSASSSSRFGHLGAEPSHSPKVVSAAAHRERVRQRRVSLGSGGRSGARKIRGDDEFRSEFGKAMRGLLGLCSARVVEGDVGLSLEATCDVEVRLSVTPEQNGLRHASEPGSGSCRSMTGTSFHSRSRA